MSIKARLLFFQDTFLHLSLIIGSNPWHMLQGHHQENFRYVCPQDVIYCRVPMDADANSLTGHSILSISSGFRRMIPGTLIHESVCNWSRFLDKKNTSESKINVQLVLELTTSKNPRIRHTVQVGIGHRVSVWFMPRHRQSQQKHCLQCVTF